MAWAEINISGISDEMEQLPEGSYVLALLNGAKFGQWDKNKIELAAKVVEGEYTGRVVYFSYPDPGTKDWSPAALKRLINALVADGADPIADNQDPIEYLNQETVVSHKFIAPVVAQTYTGQDGEEKTKVTIKLFKVRPVTQ